MFISTRKRPGGPIGQWETFEFNLSGTKVSLSCPPQNEALWDSQNSQKKRSLNIYDANKFCRSEKADPSEPLTKGILIRLWGFDGIPFWDRFPIGEIRLFIALEKMPEFNNIFRPRRLECAIERYITASSDSPQISGISRKNWQVREINNVQWVHYGQESFAGFYNAEQAFTDILHTPISSEHIMTFRFVQIYKIKKSGLAPLYQEMIEKIMHSLTIDFSEDAKASQAEAAQYPWEKLPEDLPPYEFEEVELLDQYELLDKASLSKNHDTSIPFEVYEKIAKEEDKKQKAEAKAARKRVLASHLRFEELEAEDKKRYEQSKQIIKN